MQPSKCYLFLLLLTFIHLCSYGQSKHQVKFVTGSTNNKLEVLDWGGNGRPILFLTGLGNSAHVYDGFAPKFTDKFHVYGMSRRGYGASEQTPNGYGIDTLAKDILAVVNALQLAKVVLIGHSIAGDEITAFASQYPGKVEKVIYLDAAYDHSNLSKLSFPNFPQIQEGDTASIQHFNGYLKRIRGFVFPEDEIKHQYIISANGALIKPVTPDIISLAIIQGVKVPDYKRIKSSALAIYAQRNTAQQWFPSYSLMDSVNQQKATNEFMPAWKKYYAEERNRFKSEIRKGVVKEIQGADHYVFLTHPDETEKLIRECLMQEK